MVFVPFFNRNIKIFYTKLFLSFSFLNNSNSGKVIEINMKIKSVFLPRS